MSENFDITAKLLSAPDELPIRVRSKTGARASSFQMVYGAMVIIVAFFIWNGEIPMAPLAGPDMVPNIALAVAAVGVFIALRGLSSRASAREFVVSADAVEKTAGPGETWTEPLVNYRGVRWRRSNDSEDDRQVVELVHPDPSRTVPLFVRTRRRANRKDTLKLARDAFKASRSDDADLAALEAEAIRLARQNTGNDVRDVWERLARLLGMPAIDARSSEEETRSVADLDKSLGNLVAEGRVSRAWDNRPAPDSLEVEKIGDDAETLRIKIFASGLSRLITPVFIGIGGLILVFSVISFQFGGIVGGALFIAIPFGIKKIEMSSPRVLTITGKELTYENPLRQGKRRKTFSCALTDIERIHLDRQGHQVRGRLISRSLADRLAGRLLVISTDQWEYRLGEGLDDEALEWLRDYIVSALAKA